MTETAIWRKAGMGLCLFLTTGLTACDNEALLIDSDSFQLDNGVRLQKVVTIAKGTGVGAPVIVNVTTYNVSVADTLDVVSEYTVTSEDDTPVPRNGGDFGRIIYNTIGNKAYRGDAGDIDAATQTNSSGSLSN